MTASEFNTSGSGGRAGSGGASSQSSGGQINAAKAGIKEVDEPGVDLYNHTSYWDKPSSGAGTKGSGASTSSSQVPVHERVPM